MSNQHPPRPIHKSSRSPDKVLGGVHRFEHWYRDNQVYFITARCVDRSRAFATERAKGVFWDRFEHYAQGHGFTPWITSLLDNHYHTLGYLRCGRELGEMMKRLHGSVAKMTNDVLSSLVRPRLVPFWRGEDGHDYFDGCIRDENQCRRAYRYVFNQPRRHGVCCDPAAYPHTRVRIDLDRGVRRALEIRAFLEGVPYKRYDQTRTSLRR
jgi:REP element-mobilizing transposase RayT